VSRDARSRRSPVGQPGSDSVPQLLVSRPAPPVHRVLRRQASVATEQTMPPRRDDWGARAAVAPAKPMDLSPVEMNRLTDHIVQTIDRRVAAFRERRGRV
jgi:hypothetical protein